jgi:DNA-binding MarR family transcriptional regulator
MGSEKAIGYWLFYAQRCVSYAFADALSTCCKEQKKPYEVTPAQFGFLDALKDTGLTIGALAQDRALDAPTTTGIVKRLEQNGLVQRVHDTSDRRIVKVYLTDEGRGIYGSLREAAIAFNTILLRHFSEADQQEFANRLQLIIANLSQIGVGVGDRFQVLPEHRLNFEIADFEIVDHEGKQSNE